MPQTALIVLQDRFEAERLARALPARWSALVSRDELEAMGVLGGAGVDLIILDGQETGGLLARVKEAAPRTPVLVVLSVEARERAGLLLASGAADYILTPLLPAEVCARVEGASASPPQEPAHLYRQAEEVVFLGPSPAMQGIREQLAVVAPTEIPVLIVGESGTGRGILARQIHAQSPRSLGPFLVVNCAGVSESLLEAAFFGASAPGRQTEGQLDKAGGGTLFFDEVADLPLGFQAKLLRLMRDREYLREGETEPRVASVRVLFASSRDLAAEVAARTVREDLFYRLQTFPLHVPPLRERPEDIAVLAEAFLKAFCEEAGKPFEGIEEETLECMLWYSWPGNVRELQTRMRFCSLYMSQPTLRREDLPFECQERADKTAGSYARARMQFEREYILRLLRKHQGNVNRIARESGKQRVEIYRILKKCGLSPSRFRNK